MKRVATTSALTLLVALACQGQAHAFETAGKFGIGYDADLNGVTARYFFGQFGIDLTVGFALQTARADGDGADADFIISPKMIYAWRVHDKINLNIEGGTFLEVLGASGPVGTDLSIGIFGGLAPELILWDHLSVEVFFGAALAINNLAENQAKLNVSFGTLGKQLSIVSGAVFRYYF